MAEPHPAPQRDPASIHTPSDRRARVALFALLAAYAGLYAVLCWRRYASFHAQIDMSYYLRLLFGLATGNYDLPLVQCRHFLGLHLEPVMLVFALLRRLGLPGAPLLLITQAVAVSLLAWPAYRMARRHLGSPLPALATALATLAYPTVTVATLHDFHPVTLALAPLLAALDALDEGHLWRGLGFGLLALACREDIGVQLALVYGTYALWPSEGLKHKYANLYKDKLRNLLLITSALHLLYFVIYILLIQKSYAPQFGSYNLHFAALPSGVAAGSGRELLLALLRRPWIVLPLFLGADRMLYLWQLLWPVALLPLLAPRVLAGALPILAINFLSGFPKVRSIESHYTTALVPFVIAAAILGAGRARAFLAARGRIRGVAAGLAAAMLVGTLVSHGLHGGSPLALRSPRFHSEHFSDGPEAQELRRRIAAVPPEASVAARPGPLAHLAERPRATSPPEYDDGQAVDVVLTPEAQPTGQRRIGDRLVEPVARPVVEPAAR